MKNELNREERLALLLKEFNAQIKGAVSASYYTYIYSTSGVPFYVGIGTRDTKSAAPRHLQHLGSALKGARKNFFLHKLRALRAEGTAIRITIYRCSEDRNAMAELETRFIEEYGQRCEGGVLCNRTDGGDGGRTVEHGSRKIHNGTTTKMLAPGKRLPKGWDYGTHIPFHNKVISVYNPTTGERRRVASKRDLPPGFIVGVPAGLKSGPVGKTIWRNPKTGERIWLAPGDSTNGLVKGRGVGSTTGRTVYHDSTGRHYWLDSTQRKPRGLTAGWAPNRVMGGAKPCSVFGKKYKHVQEAMKACSMTRYKLTKEPTFKML